MIKLWLVVSRFFVTHSYFVIITLMTYVYEVGKVYDERLIPYLVYQQNNLVKCDHYFCR